MKPNLKETVVLSFLGAIIFCSKLLTEALPNVHFIAMLIIAYTVVFRAKAIYAVFTFIMLSGLFYGFGIWWIPYLYLWPLLWAVTMLLPKNLSVKSAFFVYLITAGLHGFLYGTLYAPFQALAFGLDFKGMLAWIGAGIPWDIVHGIGNICTAALIIPLVKALKKALKAAKIY